MGTSQSARPVWTKSGAITRLQESRLVQEAIAISPDVRRLFTTLVCHQAEHDYSHAAAYVRFRREAEQLVGWGSPHEALRTGEHFDAVCRAIDDLLPPSIDEEYAQRLEPIDPNEEYPQLVEAVQRALGRNPTERDRLVLAAALDELARDQRDLAGAARDSAVRAWRLAA